MAKTKELREKVLRITAGAFSSLTDLALFLLISGYESLVDPMFLRSLPYSLAKSEKIFEEITASKMKRALSHVKEMSWVNEDLKVNKEGEQRLKNLFSVPVVHRAWDGNWYLVNFDIPEKLAAKRNILREKLKRLGFAKLQNSVWISPYDFLGNIEKISKEYELDPFIIFSVASKVGPLQAKILAERVWGIEKVKKEYDFFVKKYGVAGQKFFPFEVISDYRKISKKDPYLPSDLLPEDWKAERAFKIYVSCLKFQPNLS